MDSEVVPLRCIVAVGLLFICANTIPRGNEAELASTNNIAKIAHATTWSEPLVRSNKKQNEVHQ